MSETDLLDLALREVTEKTESAAGRSARGIESSGMVRLKSIRVPQQRALVKAGYDFVTQSRRDNLECWDHIWHQSNVMEVMSQSLYFYQDRLPLDRREAQAIRRWVDRACCWEHCDDLSKIFASVVESKPDWIIPTLRKWNRSSSSWLRRVSMTSLIEYATKRKAFLPFDELISFVEPLLDDPEYYVQKGLGWTVREIGNAYPDEIADFLNRYAPKLSPQAWTGATKNMNPQEKSHYKALRTLGRSRSKQQISNIE